MSYYTKMTIAEVEFEFYEEVYEIIEKSERKGGRLNLKRLEQDLDLRLERVINTRDTVYAAFENWAEENGKYPKT